MNKNKTFKEVKKEKLSSKKIERDSIFILDKEQLTHKSPLKPSPKEIKDLANSYGFDFTRLKGAGFLLDAHDPIAPTKAQLIVKPNDYLYVLNNYARPYYYKFEQMFDDSGTGLVTIKFDENFDIQNGIIFLKVGSIHSWYRPDFGYTIKIGKRNLFVRSNHDDSNGTERRFVSQTIPIVISTPPGTHRFRPLSNIEITSDMSMWKFFSASYDPYSMRVK